MSGDADLSPWLRSILYCRFWESANKSRRPALLALPSMHLPLAHTKWQCLDVRLSCFLLRLWGKCSPYCDRSPPLFSPWVSPSRVTASCVSTLWAPKTCSDLDKVFAVWANRAALPYCRRINYNGSFQSLGLFCFVLFLFTGAESGKGGRKSGESRGIVGRRWSRKVSQEHNSKKKNRESKQGLVKMHKTHTYTMSAIY